MTALRTSDLLPPADSLYCRRTRGILEENRTRCCKRTRLIQDPTRRHGYALAVALILLVSAALRLWQLSTPAEMMFDEIYYAKDAKAIVDGRVGTDGQYRWAAGDEVSWPHPEMGKFAIAAGILLFGDRSFGWRLPAVIAGIGLLACVYPLGRRLGLSPPWAAPRPAASRPPTRSASTQSRIATLDMFIAVWTVLCVLLALRYVQDGWRTRWLLLVRRRRRHGGRHQVVRRAGASSPRCSSSSSPGSCSGARHGAQRGRRSRRTRRRTKRVAGPHARPHAGLTPRCRGGAPATPAGSAGRRIALVLAALVALPVAIYLLSYTQYFLHGHTGGRLRRTAPADESIFNLSLKATHTYASLAPTWIIDYRPVWYYFEGNKTYHGVIAIGNPFLWWLATLSLVVAVCWRAAPVLRAAAGGRHRPRALRCRGSPPRGRRSSTT